MLKRGLAIAAGGILVDQLTKWAMLAHVFNLPFDRVGGVLPRAFPVEITSFFNLVTVWNKGVSFGIMSNDSPWGPWVLSGLALLICGWLIHHLRHVQNGFGAFATGMILAGAIGNVIDRVRIGAVYDFLDFHYAGYHWPAFNGADIFIFVGVVCFLLDDLFSKREN